MPGAGTSTSKTNQTQSQVQNSSTNPWLPTIAPLQNIIGGISGQVPNYQPTSAETGALGTLAQNAANQPNYGSQAYGLANSLLGNTTGQASGILNNAYGQTQGALSPYLSSNYLDPTQTPGISNLLSTIRSDVSNNVNGLFAGAGRDLSGLNQQALARGISQGEAVPLLNQYNANVAAQQGAANSLFGAGNTTAQGLQNLTQTGLQNQLAGLNAGASVAPQVQNAPAMNALDAASLARGLPLNNLQGLSNLLLPIAGLGGQSTGASFGSGTSKTQQTASPLQMALQGATLLGML